MDRHGRAQAVVVITPARRWWALWLRLSWPPADRMPWLKRTLVRLAFIHVAHWSLVGKLRGYGAARARRLPYPYLLFQSNFNDDLPAYIDAFALIVPWRMRLMWHGVHGFPGPTAVDRFLDFVLQSATPVQHYYCAYPEGSARMISSAFELSEHSREFEEQTAAADDEAFTAAWWQFVADNQRLL